MSKRNGINSSCPSVFQSHFILLEAVLHITRHRKPKNLVLRHFRSPLSAELLDLIPTEGNEKNHFLQCESNLQSLLRSLSHACVPLKIGLKFHTFLIKFLTIFIRDKLHKLHKNANVIVRLLRERLIMLKLIISEARQNLDTTRPAIKPFLRKLYNISN